MADIIDDGSLACLHIPRDEKNRSFNCDETTQSKLVNIQFWVVDNIEDVPDGELEQTVRDIESKQYKQALAPWLGWAKQATKNIY